MPDLLDKRLVFVAGKGGVGKTTVAAALGMAAARRGKRTIVCEVSEQERMSRAFRREGIGFEEAELVEDLYAISVDPEKALEEYVQFQLPSRALASVLNRSQIFQYLTAAAPGMRELVSMGKVWELAQLERVRAGAAPYDLVIVDSPATGHGLALMRAPRTFRDIARMGPIHRQAGKIHSFVSDPRTTGVLAVALPEEMPVTETLELRDRLQAEMGMDMDAVVVNGLYPERFSGADAERIAAMDGQVSPELRAALEAALFEHRRARAQRSQLRRLRRAADGPVATLPYLFEPELGLDQFERLSRELERKL